MYSPPLPLLPSGQIGEGSPSPIFLEWGRGSVHRLSSGGGRTWRFDFINLRHQEQITLLIQQKPYMKHKLAAAGWKAKKYFS